MKYLFKIKSRILPLLLLVSGITSMEVMATHNRAGEITFSQVSAYTFEITLITYTDSRSMDADRKSVEIKWGDNTSSNVSRDQQVYEGNFIFRNVYVHRHTYPGPGKYIIQFQDPNRIKDIRNISNSVFIPFYIETELQIDPFLGFNRSPVLLQPPIDFARVGEVFTHYPNAYDADGDSLYFTLIPPKSDKGVDVNGYFVPTSSDSFHLDPFTGKITWETPVQIGIYNIAILIDEFRNGQRIGYVIRDMQIIVRASDNRPPKLYNLIDTCVEAGTNLALLLNVWAADPDVNDVVTITATGGPFLQQVNPAYLSPDPASGTGQANVDFNWQVSCNHIRKQPYMVVFKAEDNHPLVPLTDLKHLLIRVIGPAPLNLTSSAVGNNINLNWDKPVCGNVRGYFVYRKPSPSNWNPSYCETGVPAYTGFQLIDTIFGSDITYYSDNNKGAGLKPGMNYCYRVTAIYLEEGQFEIAEGYASNETCSEFIKDVPIITHVTIDETDQQAGALTLKWLKPADIDTLQHPAPYTYKIYEANNQGNSNAQPVATITRNSYAELNDSIYLPQNLNTVSNPYSYRIHFYSTVQSESVLVETTPVASSVFLQIIPQNERLRLQWNENVPWSNFNYVIYKKNDQTGHFDSIGHTNKKFFIDYGLVNGETYCYYVKSQGSYFSQSFPDTLENYSQKVCASPMDTVPPCPPYITAVGNCDERSTTLKWEFPDEFCADDLNYVNIFFSRSQDGEFTYIDKVMSYDVNSYIDNRDELQNSMAGCYKFTAVDSVGNESDFTYTVCVDNCPRYQLPNVFTPNNDNINDYFVPFNDYRFIESIDIQIFNRWGQVVFHTTDLEIMWDGKDMNNGNDLGSGVYYYICRVNEIYLRGIVSRDIHGAIHLIR